MIREKFAREGFTTLSNALKRLSEMGDIEDYDSEIREVWLYGCCFHRTPELTIAAIDYIDRLMRGLDHVRLQSRKETCDRIGIAIDTANKLRFAMFAFVDEYRTNYERIANTITPPEDPQAPSSPSE